MRLEEKSGETILDDAHEFCAKNYICKLEMEDEYIDPKRWRHKYGITNKHYYQVCCFNNIIDWLLQEFDNETSSELLLCSAAFSPRDSFHDFNKEKMMSLANLYRYDFDYRGFEGP